MDHKLFVNLGQHQLSDTELNVLSLGMNFATIPNKIPVELIQSIQLSIRKLDKEKADDIRIHIHEVLKNFKPPKSLDTHPEG